MQWNNSGPSERDFHISWAASAFYFIACETVRNASFMQDIRPMTVLFDGLSDSVSL